MNYLARNNSVICLMIVWASVMCSCSLEFLREESPRGSLEQTPSSNRVFSKDSVQPKNSGSESQSKQVLAFLDSLNCRGVTKLAADRNPELQEILNNLKALEPKGVIDTKALKATTAHSSEIAGVFPVLGSGGDIQQIVSADKLGKVLVWQRVKGNWRAFELITLQGQPGAVAFHSRGGFIAAARPGRIEVIAAQSGKVLFSLERLKTRVTSLDFSPCGDALVIAGADGMVYRWKYLNEAAAETLSEKERSLERYFGHGSVVSKVLYHPYGRLFFSSDWQGVVSAWRPYDTDSFEGVYDTNAVEGRLFTEENERATGSRKNSDIVEVIKIDREGKHLFVATETGGLEVWQVRGFRQIGETQAHTGTIFSLAVSPKGDRLATVGRDGNLAIWKFTLKPSESVTGGLDAELEKIKELKLDHAGILIFLDEDTLIAGNSKGQLLQIDIKI